MQFAEVFLRLGSGLVAWMMLYAHLLWLAALHAMGCGPDGDEMHNLLLVLAPITIGTAFVIRATRPLHDIHGILRWLGIPLFLLMPFALRSTWDVFVRVNQESLAICGPGTPGGWQPYWAGLQVLTLTVVTYMVLNVFMSVKADASSTVD